jgi:glycogen operon protein
LLDLLQRVQVQFYDVNLNPADEGDTSHSLAMSRRSPTGLIHFFLMVNAYWEPLTFQTPPLAADMVGWRVWIDTSQPAPRDIHGWNDAPLLTETTCTAGPRSVVVLAAA